MKAYIKAIDFYVPEISVSDDDIQRRFPNYDVPRTSNIIGVHNRYVAPKDITSRNLAEKAAEKIFDNNSDVDKDDIDYIIFVTQTSDYKQPSTACIIQHELGLRNNIGAFDVNLGCSGYLYGLSISKALIESGMVKNVLVLTAETSTRNVHPQDVGSFLMFGEAGTATIVSTEGFAAIGDFEHGTDGAGYDKLIIRTGGYKFPEKANDAHFDEEGNIVSSDHACMDGNEVFVFTIRVVPKLVKASLGKNNLTINDIDLFIFHQANTFILEFLRKKMKIAPEKFYIDMEKYGNTSSCTVPICIVNAINQGRIKSGYKVSISAFGIGYSWAGTVLSF